MSSNRKDILKCLHDNFSYFCISQIKLFCMHPTKQIMMENKLEVHKDRTLKEAVEIAYKVCHA